MDPILRAAAKSWPNFRSKFPSVFRLDHVSRNVLAARINEAKGLGNLNVTLSSSSSFDGRYVKFLTPKGQNQVSALHRCPYYRGRECRIFAISGTK